MNGEESITVTNAEYVNINPHKVKINFVIPLKNRGKFIRLLLDNIAQIVKDTNETNIKVWIGDYHSTDINLAEHIKQFSFPIEIVWFHGVFLIAKCLQLTAEHVLNPDEIIYFCDADSGFPPDILNRIRNYTIKNKQFYVPMVARQDGSGRIIPPYPPRGHGGKGNVGVYVDDFVKSKGWATGFFHQDGIGSGNPMTRKQWGKHDEHIFHLLYIGMGLIPHRPREPDQFIRWHTPRLGWGK